MMRHQYLFTTKLFFFFPSPLWNVSLVWLNSEKGQGFSVDTEKTLPTSFRAVKRTMV